MGGTVTCYPRNATAGGAGGGSSTDGGSPSWYLLAGMGFTLFSSFAVSLGTVLQKKALDIDAAKPVHLKGPRRGGFLCTPLWIFGFLTMALLQIPLSFAALALAPQSVVIPLGAGATIVFTQILAVCIVHEKMSRRQVLATLIVVAGIVMVSTSNSDGKTTEVTVCGILARYTEPDFLVPMLFIMTGLVACVVAVRYDKIRKQFQIFVYAAIAGSMGALLNVFLKVVGEFTQGALAGDKEASSVWGTIHPWYSLIAVIACAVGMMAFINLGLEKFPALVFLPMYNCLFIILSTLLGGIFFKEFWSFSAKAWIFFLAGVVTTIVGISMLSCGAPQSAEVRGENGFEGDEMQQFGRGPGDPTEPNYFDADLTLDERKFAGAPTLSRLVLI